MGSDQEWKVREFMKTARPWMLKFLRENPEATELPATRPKKPNAPRPTFSCDCGKTYRSKLAVTACKARDHKEIK